MLDEPMYMKVDKTKKFGIGQSSPSGGVKVSHRRSIGEPETSVTVSKLFNMQKAMPSRRESVEHV